MKKIIALILALCLFVPFMAMNASADEVGIKGITFESEQKDGKDVVEIVPRGTSTGVDALIDGERLADATVFSTTGVITFKNTLCTTADYFPEFSLIIELDKAANISGAAITFFHEYNVMIGVSKDSSVIVEVSANGTDYDLINDFDYDIEAVDGQAKSETAELVFDSEEKVSFIKFTFAFGPSPFTTDGKVVWEWIGMTEIEVYADDTVIEVSDEPSVEPSEEPDTTEEPTTPTGDSTTYIALAVIAMVTLAGAVVVKKVR